MKLVVKLFGPQAVIAGRRELELEITGERTTVAEVRRALEESVPGLADSSSSSRLAVNWEIAGETDFVGSGDELALIGMVSGG